MNAPSTQDNYAERIVRIRNPHGLHMRPAVRFVDQANSYGGLVAIEKGSQRVDGKSIMQLTLLRATQGTELKLVVTGENAGAIIDSLAAILEEVIEDGEDALASPPGPSESS
jgi:phosphocarrier protein